MFASVFLATLGLVASASAFKVPAGIEHGHLYAIIVDDSGNETWEKMDVNVTGSPHPSYSAKFLERRRSFPEGSFAACDGNRIQDWDLFQPDGASDRFITGCNALGSQHLTGRPRAFSVPFGTVVAFMCNYSTKGNPCNSQEFSTSISNVRAQCTGSGSGGTDQCGEFCDVSLFP